jgi:ATP adenylyltransferase
MKKLWAPWRKTYIRPDKPARGCVFCRLTRGGRSGEHVLKRTRHSFAVLNLYPYNNGHTLVLPLRHVDSIADLSDEERLDWLELFEDVRKALARALKPHGFNAGINLGRTAGAGIPGHLHFHLVPRWDGDTNFMPVIAQTKVISESLDSVFREVKRYLK